MNLDFPSLSIKLITSITRTENLIFTSKIFFSPTCLSLSLCPVCYVTVNAPYKRRPKYLAVASLRW